MKDASGAQMETAKALLSGLGIVVLCSAAGGGRVMWAALLHCRPWLRLLILNWMRTASDCLWALGLQKSIDCFQEALAVEKAAGVFADAQGHAAASCM